MGSPGGYAVNPGLYRIPDLLTEQQLVDYMWNTYGRKIEFTDGVEVNPARALGQTHPVGPVDEVDSDKTSPNAINDPTLRHLNEMNFGPTYASTVTAEEETSEEYVEEGLEGPIDPTVDETDENK